MHRATVGAALAAAALCLIATIQGCAALQRDSEGYIVGRATYWDVDYTKVVS